LHESFEHSEAAFHAASVIFQDDFIRFVEFGVKLHATDIFSKTELLSF